MAETRSPLAHLDGSMIEVDAIRLVEYADVGKVNLRGDPDDANFLAAVREAAGIDLPQAPNTSSETPPLSALWLSPDEWLLICAGGSEGDVVKSLAAALVTHHASVVDVTDARTVFRLSGADARTLLAKGCALDLHKRVFALGDVAQTMLSKAAVILHQTVDDAEEPGPVFDIYVPRSFADYLWSWLADAVD
jgi:sarcosine oxidase subunit gamma